MIPCLGGPLDGESVSDRGAMFQPVGGSGLYVREGAVYRWWPHT